MRRILRSVRQTPCGFCKEFVICLLFLCFIYGPRTLIWIYAQHFFSVGKDMKQKTFLHLFHRIDFIAYSPIILVTKWVDKKKCNLICNVTAQSSLLKTFRIFCLLKFLDQLTDKPELIKMDHACSRGLLIERFALMNHILIGVGIKSEAIKRKR